MSYKKIGKLSTLSLFLFVFLLSVIGLTYAPYSAEASFSGRSSNQGFFDNNRYSGTNGRRVWGPGAAFGFDNTNLPSPYPSSVNNIDQFVDYYYWFVRSTDDHRSTGASFTVLNMLGAPPGTPRRQAVTRFGEWEALVRQYHSAGRINFSQNYSYSTNTLYDELNDDVVWYNESDTRASVVFRSLTNNTVVYAIKRDCANPVGPMEALPRSVPFTVRSNLIAGGVNGGGGPDLNGNFSASHAITQTGSFGVSTRRNAALTFRGDTGNGNNVVVSAPFSVTDSSGRVWERQGSSRCYNTSGSCRSSGVQNSTLRRRTFDPDGIVSNGGTVRVYWFYAVQDRSPTFSLSADCSSITIRNISDPDTSGSLFMTVTVGGEEVFRGNTNQGTRTFTYPQSRQNSSNNIVRVTVNSFVPSGSSSAGNTTRSVVVPPCFQASCTDESINPSSGIIVAGDNFSTQARFRNDGELAWNAGGRVTTRAVYNGNTISRTVPPTTSGGITPWISYGDYTSPSTLDRQSVVMYLEVDGSELARCDIAFDPYTRFELTPNNDSSSFTPDAENPNTFTYSSFVRATYSPVGGAPAINGPRATRIIERIRGGSTSEVDRDGSFTGGYTTSRPNFSDSVSVSDFRAGDEYCGRLIVDRTTGLINRNGDVRNLSGPSAETDPICETIVDQPYVAVFGADVIAGNGYEGSCSSATPGFISAFYDLTNLRGSGTQFASLAMSQIEGFVSSRINSPPDSLSFANTSGSYGGGLRQLQCSSDYFAQMPSDVRSGPIDFNRSGGYSLTSGTTIPASQISNGVRIGVYVEGDVVLSGNLVYQNNSWGILDQIPSFFLVATGDVFIDASVTQLDGTYVSQGGTIYTCTNGSAPRNERQMFDECQEQLIVNGSLIANTVKFNRYANSSLRYGDRSEFPYSGSTRECGDGNRRTICAAEVINFSPELYLVPPQLRPTSSPGQSRYDAITSLPPVL